MKSLLLVIDLQKSFINENTKYLIDRINNLVNSSMYDYVIFTKFINKINSIGVKKLNYMGCLSDEDREIVLDTKDKMIFEKDVYTAYSKKLVDYIKSNNIDVIYLCGIDTECCVLKTAFDLFENGYDVKVLRDYSASTHGMESNNYILDVIGRSIGRDNVI